MLIRLEAASEACERDAKTVTKLSQEGMWEGDCCGRRPGTCFC